MYLLYCICCIWASRWFSRWRICLQCRSCRGCGLSPWVKIPWRRSWQPNPVFLPGKFHKQRIHVDCSTWGPWVGQDWTCVHILCLVSPLLLWRWGTKFLLCYNRRQYNVIFFLKEKIFAILEYNLYTEWKWSCFHENDHVLKHCPDTRLWMSQVSF